MSHFAVSDARPPRTATSTKTKQETVVTVTPTGENATYNIKAARILGIIQIVLGSLSALCGVILCSFVTGSYACGYTIFCGIVYIISGMLGLTSVDRKTYKIIGFMVMSILSAVLAPAQIAEDQAYTFFEELPTPLIPMCSVAAAFTEIIVGIVSAVFCCRGATCCNRFKCWRDSAQDHGTAQYSSQGGTTNVTTDVQTNDASAQEMKPLTTSQA